MEPRYSAIGRSYRIESDYGIAFGYDRFDYRSSKS